MKQITKLLCIILVTTIIILLIPNVANSYNIYTYHSFKNFGEIRILQNQNEVFLVGSNGKNVTIESVYPETFNIELNLENDVYTFELFDSTLVMVCPNNIIKQTQIVLYDIYTDSFTTFSISTIDYPEFSQIAYYDSSVYISDDNGSVKKYSIYGKLLSTYNIHHDSVYLSVNPSGDIYAIASNGLYEIYDDSFKLVSSQHLDAPIKFISNEIFINDVGYYYKMNINNISRIIDSKSTVYYPSGGITDNHVLIANNNLLYGVDITSNNADRYISFSNYIEEICFIDSAILVLSYQNGLPTVSKATYSDMIKLNQNNSDTEINDNNIPYSITSNIYTINNDNQTITDIGYSTTITEFKNNINYDGFDVSFTRYDGKVIKSGNVGTATIVRFYNDDYFVEYELSVTGDLTGEGNVNSRDKKMMFSYLLDEVMFSGVYIDSADIDNSDRIDTIDLVLLLRLIEEQK